MKETISIRLDKDLAEKLDALCKRTDRNQSWHAREALSRYLADEAGDAEVPYKPQPLVFTKEQLYEHVSNMAGKIRKGEYE